VSTAFAASAGVLARGLGRGCGKYSKSVSEYGTPLRFDLNSLQVFHWAFVLCLQYSPSAAIIGLLSPMEYRPCIVFVMNDDSMRRVYRLYDPTKSGRGHAWRMCRRVRESHQHGYSLS
jgi:hypothetical protein